MKKKELAKRYLLFVFSLFVLAFVVFCVVLSVVLSLIFFEGQILGTREGTLIAAVFTGMLVKVFKPILSRPLEKFLLK